MTTACVAIIVVVVISSFMCIRRGYRKLGYCILPISMVPLGHIIGGRLLLMLRAKSIVPETAAMSIVTAVDVAALVAGASIIIACSKSFFKHRKSRNIYCIIMTAFTAILTLVLLINFYGEIL